jgi:uracil-DNA glycosylase family protein
LAKPPRKRTPQPVPTSELDALREAAADCTACPLFRDATQTVFGEGDPRSRLVLVGEQPGDAEDRVGRPFVGPAGRLLDRALAVAGIDRALVYVTNAVKHFKWTPRGKRRIHKTPAQREIDACSRWLEGELAAIAPALVVCLGATAARAVVGPDARVGALRGKVLERTGAPPVVVTVHPSFVLRLQGPEQDRAFDELVGDLRLAARFLGGA